MLISCLKPSMYTFMSVPIDQSVSKEYILLNKIFLIYTK